MLNNHIHIYIYTIYIYITCVFLLPRKINLHLPFTLRDAEGHVHPSGSVSLARQGLCERREARGVHEHDDGFESALVVDMLHVQKLHMSTESQVSEVLCCRAKTL